MQNATVGVYLEGFTLSRQPASSSGIADRRVLHGAALPRSSPVITRNRAIIVGDFWNFTGIYILIARICRSTTPPANCPAGTRASDLRRISLRRFPGA
jgi:hypothetical protein